MRQFAELLRLPFAQFSAELEVEGDEGGDQGDEEGRGQDRAQLRIYTNLLNRDPSGESGAWTNC